MTSSSTHRTQGNLLTRLAHWVAPVVILLLGVGIAVAMVKTKPKATRTPPKREARRVETLPVVVTTAVTRVHAMGSVIPSTEVALQPRVSGEVVHMAEELVPGGQIVQGQTLLRIDPTDYALASRRARSDVASVESDVMVEMGRQAVAEQEFDMLGMDMTDEERDRVLRKPQLDKLRAGLATAEAQLEQAELNLARTDVRAPFNAVVRDRYVNLGAQVSSGTRLATVVGTDSFWVEVTVPVRELHWIQIPRLQGEPGARVQIHNDSSWLPGTVRTGQVVRLLSELEPQGLMARLLIEVEDPLSLDADPRIQPPMLLGEYVRVEIEGRTLTDVVVLDRTLVRGSNSVWLMTEASALEIREVGIAYESRDAVYVDRGLIEGEQIVATNLSSPVNGLPLRTAESAEPVSTGAGERP